MKKINNTVETTQNETNTRTDNVNLEDLNLEMSDFNAASFSGFVQKHGKKLASPNKYLFILLILLVIFFMGLFISREIAIHVKSHQIVDLTQHLSRVDHDSHVKQVEQMQQTLSLSKANDEAKEQLKKYISEVKQQENKLREKDAIIDDLKKQLANKSEELSKALASAKKYQDCSKNNSKQNLQDFEQKDKQISDLKRHIKDISDEFKTEINSMKAELRNASVRYENDTIFSQNEMDTLREKAQNSGSFNSSNDHEIHKLKEERDAMKNAAIYKENENKKLQNEIIECNNEVSKHKQIHEDLKINITDLSKNKDQIESGCAKKDLLLIENDIVIKEMNEELTNKTQDVKELSQELIRADSKISELQKMHQFEMEKSSKNLTVLVNDLEMLKQEFNQVNIKLYIPKLNPRPDDNATYNCAITSCRKEFLRDDLVLHLMDSHPQNVVVNTEMVHKSSEGHSWERIYMMCYGELFRVGIRFYPDGNVWFYLMFFGPSDLSTKYKYEVELLAPIRTRKSLIVTGNCDKYISIYGNAILNYVKIDAVRAAPYIDDHRTLQFRLKILEK